MILGTVFEKMEILRSLVMPTIAEPGTLFQSDIPYRGRTLSQSGAAFPNDVGRNISYFALCYNLLDSTVC